jgi:outer membrane immunogenic protein
MQKGQTRTCFILLLMMGMVLTVTAQSKITWGMSAGISSSTIHHEGWSFFAIGSNSRIGFQGGVFVNVPVYKSLSIQPELGYNSLRSLQKYAVAGAADQPVGTLDQITTLNYIQFALLPKFTIGKTGISLLAGPSIGYQVHAFNSFYFYPLYPNSGESFIQQDYETWCLSGIAGIEYYLPAGIGFSARYQYGFSNITPPLPFVDNKNYNRSFFFSLNYRFK